MSEEEFERYLDAVSARLGLSGRRREEVREELRAHLDEQWEELCGGSGPRERRVARVLADFGPADRLAAGIRLPYRRRAVRIAGIMAASLLMTLMLHGQWRRPGGGQQAGFGGGPMLAGSSLWLVSGDQENAEDQAFQALQKHLPRVAFDETPLEDVLDNLREASGANIWVNWPALAREGIDGDTPVTVQLEDVILGRLLDLICAELCQEGASVAFGHSHNVIEFSTASALRSPTPDVTAVQAVYDVRKIVEAARDSRRVARQRGGEPGKAATPVEDPDETPGELIEVITQTISPDDWSRKGGRLGSVEYFAGLLVVRAPAVTQAKVADLLEQMGDRLASRQPAATEGATAAEGRGGGRAGTGGGGRSGASGGRAEGRSMAR
jgi:hypothetical protein